MINEEAARRVIEWIAEAKKGGAKLLCGGVCRGGIVIPTVLTNTRP